MSAEPGLTDIPPLAQRVPTIDVSIPDHVLTVSSYTLARPLGRLVVYGLDPVVLTGAQLCSFSLSPQSPAPRRLTPVANCGYGRSCRCRRSCING